MSEKFSRRRFLELGAATAGGLALNAILPKDVFAQSHSQHTATENQGIVAPEKPFIEKELLYRGKDEVGFPLIGGHGNIFTAEVEDFKGRYFESKIYGRPLHGDAFPIATSGLTNREGNIYRHLLAYAHGNGTYSRGIRLYDLLRRHHRLIIEGENIKSDPHINGDKLFWVDSRSGREEIYGYNLKADREFLVAKNSGQNIEEKSSPVANSKNIVWIEGHNGRWDEIVIADRKNLEQIHRVPTPVGHFLKPTISENGKIATIVSDLRGPESLQEVFLIDAKAGEVNKIFSDPRYFASGVKISGNWIIGCINDRDLEKTQSFIVGGNLKTGKTFVLEDNNIFSPDLLSLNDHQALISYAKGFTVYGQEREIWKAKVTL